MICSETLQGIKNSTRIFDPYQRSTYSNVNYVLLGVVLSRMANSTYSDIIQQSILDPLDLKHTYLKKPLDSAGVIPVTNSSWRHAYGEASLP